MRSRASRRTVRPSRLTSILSLTPRARKAAADWRIRCACCGATVESHITAGNRWIGCRGGAR